MRILLVEDEKSLREVIKLNLELETWEVMCANDGAIAIQKLQEQYFDIVVLDLMLPKINGIDVLKNIKVNHPQLPVIIVSAKNTSTDRIFGLSTGADDYLSKPFEIEELILRIKKLVDRNPISTETVIEDKYSFGNNIIDFKAFTASKGNTQFELTTKEVQILKMLIQNKNKVVSRHEILKSVWGYDVFPSTRTIDNFIASLRKYFEEDPRQPVYIKSIRGIGYKFCDSEN